MEDLLILTDTHDNEIGTMSKEEAHRLGKLHRAFSIFIFTSDGRILLQQRHPNKYHSGGLWANSCCSHPRSGEGLIEAAHRRLKQELNIDTQLTEAFSFIYRSIYGPNLYEYEFDHVFYGYCDDVPVYDEDEVQDVRYVMPELLRLELIEHPDHFASWFLIAAPRLLDQLGIAMD